MNRTTMILLLLMGAFAVISIIVLQDPEQSRRLAEAQRSIAFTGESRDMAMMGFFLLVGGFVAYLLFTRK
jgi:nitric oxide reductase large subunit